MKRIVSISFVCAALVAVLAAYAVPHHHHGVAVCGVEFGDFQCGGQHGDTPQSPETSHSDGGTCVAEGEFITPSENGDEGVKCASGGCDHSGCATAALIVAALLSVEFSAGAVDVCVGDPFISYTSVDIAAAGPLRAPPATLC